MNRNHQIVIETLWFSLDDPIVFLEKFILWLNAMNQATGGLTVRWDVAVRAEP
jgi:hypothetical protein